MGQRVYLRKDVLTAVRERLHDIFNRFETVVISVSGGKDSTLLFDLAWKVAQALGREVHTFFLDQEAEYQDTIEVIRDIMGRPGVVPHWYQVPIQMTNATSASTDFLYAWEPGAAWMRDKDPLAIHAINGDYPQRFYPFIDWFEQQWDTNTCFLVGLRAEESLNRYRAVIKHPAIPGWPWSSRGKGNVIKLYPIYDWSFDDIWLYFYQEGVRYNRIYDFIHATDEREQITKYRVSFLLHEKSYQSLTTLQRFEPETYERLLRRIPGIRTAARYAEEQMYQANTLPDGFASWRDYRDHLLEQLPTGHTERFRDRFARQQDTPAVHRQQVKQLLINDWENNIPVKQQEHEDWRQKWWDIL